MDKFLETISGRIGLDLKYFVKNSFFLMMKYFIVTIIGIMMGMIYSRFISKEVYGDYQLVIAFTTTIGFLSLPGFNKGLCSDVARGKEGALDVTVKEKIKYGSIGSLLLLILSIKYYIDGDVVFASCLIVAALTFPLFSNGNTWEFFLENKKEYKLATSLGLAANFISKIAIIIAIFISSGSLLLLVTASLTSVALINYIGLKIAYTKKRNNEVSEDFKNYGFFLTKTGVLRDMLLKIDSLLIGIFMGPTELAVYSFSQIIPDQIAGLIGSIFEVVTPKIAEYKREMVEKKIKEKAFWIFLISMSLIIMAIIVTPFAIRVLFTENYAESILYSQIITAGLAFYVFEVAFAKVLLVKKCKPQLLKLNIITPLFRTTAIIVGYLTYGLVGVAVGNALGRFINLLTILSFHKKEYDN